MVVLSGYPSDLYDHALPNWTRVQRDALADGARKRVEVLWINPAASERLGHGPLFEGLSATPTTEYTRAAGAAQAGNAPALVAGADMANFGASCKEAV